MKKSNYLRLAAVLFFLPAFFVQVYSQCSDAGICVLKHIENDSLNNKLSSVSIGLAYGSSGKETDINGALNDLYFSSVIAEADLAISDKSRLRFGIPFTIINGPLGENKGVGDLSVLYSRKFIIKKKHCLTISIGGKLSIADVNTTDSLPQRYMPGLGTNDIILGVTYGYQYYSISLGYQKPFGRSNNFRTRLKRGDDVFFRAGYNQRFNQVIVKAEILTMLRIQKSSILVSGTDNFTDIEGSNEPQVNLLVSAGFAATKNVQLFIEAAIPFLNRDYNYDGLKRKLTLKASVSYLFRL